MEISVLERAAEDFSRGAEHLKDVYVDDLKKLLGS